ncbi:MAG: hypothetical protein AAGF93_00750 [Cyanobacteria bacterium P01_H01_bin.105]
MCFSNYRRTIGLGAGIIIYCGACQAPSDVGVPAISLPKATVTVESLRQPQQVEQSVPLSGSVIQRLAILNGWLYQIDDGTGQVWVLTQQTAPEIDQQVYVKGVLRYEAIIINEADLGDYYLEEQERQLQQSKTP